MQTPPAGQRLRAPAAPAPLLVTAGSCLVVVAVLGWAVAAEFPPLLRLDRAVSVALYAGDDRSQALDTVLKVLTAPGGWGVRTLVLLGTVAWLAARRAWWATAWVVAVAASVAPLTTLLKELLARQRPQFAEGGAGYESLSYPSGHSSGIASVVTVALVLAWPLLAPGARRAWSAVGAAVVVLVGLTRMWLGVHYLSDVVGGWALGVGWTLLLAVAFGALTDGRAALRPRTTR